jgi:hypothetical protein
MRSWRAAVGVLILAGCLAPPVVGVTPIPTRGCPSEQLSVGTPGWIEANKTQVLAEYTPRLADLSGLVADLADTPLAGVAVLLRRGRIAPGSDTGARARTTNADGEFRFDSLAAVDYVLEFRKPGFETQWHQYRGITAIVDSLCVHMRTAPPFKLTPLSPQ